MKKARNSILSVLIAAVMAFTAIPAIPPSVVPMTAEANESSATVELGVEGVTDTMARIRTVLQEAINALPANGTLAVTGAYNEPSNSESPGIPLNIPADKGVFWRANHANRGRYTTAVITLAGPGTFTMSEGTLTSNGGNAPVFHVNAAATLVVNGGIISGETGTAVHLRASNSRVIVNGGTIRSNAASGRAIATSASGTQIFMNGGTVTSANGIAIEALHTPFNMVGGTISATGANGEAIRAISSPISIIAGTITSANTQAQSGTIIATCSSDAAITIGGSATVRNTGSGGNAIHTNMSTTVQSGATVETHSGNGINNTSSTARVVVTSAARVTVTNADSRVAGVRAAGVIEVSGTAVVNRLSNTGAATTSQIIIGGEARVWAGRGTAVTASGNTRVTVNGGSIEAEGASGDRLGIVATNNAQVTINDGTITTSSGIAVSAADNARVTVNGGLIRSTTASPSTGIGIRAANNSLVQINGGTVRAAWGTAVTMSDATRLTITDGLLTSSGSSNPAVSSSSTGRISLTFTDAGENIGGVVENTGGGSAIRAAGSVVVYSGEVRATSVAAAIAATGANTSLAVLGGTVTAGASGTRLSSTGANSVIIDFTGTFPASYQFGTSTDLTVTPADATAQWAFYDGMHAVTFMRGTNSGFVEVFSGLTVTGIPNERTITFNPNGGSVSATTYKVIAGNPILTTLPTPTRSNYTFSGWYSTEGFTSGSRVVETTIVTADMTVWARWTRITQRLTVSGGGTGATVSGDRDQGSQVTINAGTPPANRRFSHWTSSPAVTFADRELSPTTFTMPANAVTVTANFVAITHRLTVNSSGVGATASGDRNQAASVSVSAGTAPANQRFVRWNAEGVTLSNPASSVVSFNMPSNPVTLTAVFEPITRTLTVVSNGMGATPDSSPAQGVTVHIGAGFPPENHRFVRWTANSSLVNFADAYNPNTTFTMPSTGVIVTAVFEQFRHELLITSPGFGGTEAASIRGHGDMVSIDAGTPPANYRFARWVAISLFGEVLFANPTSPTTIFVMPNGPVALVATFERISFTVNFYPNGGSSVSPQTVVPGGTLGSLPSSTRDGHRFMGWYTTSNFAEGSRVSGFTPVAGDLTLWARWEQTSAANPCSECNKFPCECCFMCHKADCICFANCFLCGQDPCECPTFAPTLVSRTLTNLDCACCSSPVKIMMTSLSENCTETNTMTVTVRLSAKRVGEDADVAMNSIVRTRTNMNTFDMVTETLCLQTGEWIPFVFEL